ncbi:MAG: signal peptide peptidase SppA, partial [Nitrosopumilus sp.]|nr:signal peptide peptidase SppA [Nitrosopumilus sp.]
MKQFFKFVFASMLGFILATLFVFIISFVFFAAVISGLESKTPEIKANSVLHMTFTEPVIERSSNNPFKNLEFFPFASKSKLGLNDILNNLDKAAKDDNIKGIFLDLSDVNSGTSALKEIRDAMLVFKNSGKFIIAYGDFYSQGAYYLASVADEIYLNPIGLLEFKGLAATVTFFKGTLDKLEIEPQVIKHGKYKSAAESFVEKEMSPESKEQIAAIVDDIYDTFLNDISKSRNIEVGELRNIADQLLLQVTDDAVKYRFVDGLKYYDEILAILKERSGIDADKELQLAEMIKYTDVPKKHEDGISRDRIAVIYAIGNIVDGEDDDDEIIASKNVAKTIREAREDENVKAIVLRVNSPGGSAIASDVILREIKLAKQSKPVVVSMSNVAASGGYYISCAADVIVAQPNTITGSIGVIGLLMNGKKLLNNKLGVTLDTYKTGSYADIGSFGRPVTEYERKVILVMIDDIYQKFINHVAEGRNLDVAFVDSIAQGRVWSGIDAMQLGLVDTLGGVDVAINIAAQKAGLEKYRIKELPEQKDPFEVILKE